MNESYSVFYCLWLFFVFYDVSLFLKTDYIPAVGLHSSIVTVPKRK